MDDVTCAPRPFPASRETVAVRQPRPVGAWRSPTHVRPRFLPLKFKHRGGSAGVSAVLSWWSLAVFRGLGPLVAKGP